VSDHERDAGEQMVHDTASAPSMNIASNQRAELLQKWHRQDAIAEAERHEKESQQEP
jgi:hypothetical protein